MAVEEQVGLNPPWKMSTERYSIRSPSYLTKKLTLVLDPVVFVPLPSTDEHLSASQTRTWILLCQLHGAVSPGIIAWSFSLTCSLVPQADFDHGNGDRLVAQYRRLVDAGRIRCRHLSAWDCSEYISRFCLRMGLLRLGTTNRAVHGEELCLLEVPVFMATQDSLCTKLLI